MGGPPKEPQRNASGTIMLGFCGFDSGCSVERGAVEEVPRPTLQSILKFIKHARSMYGTTFKGPGEWQSVLY